MVLRLTFVKSLLTVRMTVKMSMVVTVSMTVSMTVIKISARARKSERSLRARSQSAAASSPAMQMAEMEDPVVIRMETIYMLMAHFLVLSRASSSVKNGSGSPPTRTAWGRPFGVLVSLETRKR